MEEALVPYPVTESMASGVAWPFADQPFAPLSLREGSPAYITGGPQPLGQLQNAYIVAQGQEGLLAVDQHAAHELVLYEQLMAGRETHPLSPPLRIELTQREAELLTPFLTAFVDLGLELESFGGNAFLLRGLPAALVGSQPNELVAGLLGELPGYQALDPESVRERLAMKAACTSAIKAGDILSQEQMVGLLNSLEAAWSPATCPHGRPAFVLLTTEELERRFMRR